MYLNALGSLYLNATQVVHATGGHTVRMGNPGALRYDQAGNPTESKILLMDQMSIWTKDQRTAADTCKGNPSM